MKFNKRVTSINLFKKCKYKKIFVNFSILYATKISPVNNSNQIINTNCEKTIVRNVVKFN